MRTIEWAAGLFEGEGTIIIRPGRKKAKAGNIEIALTSTDEDVVREYARVVRTGVVYGPYHYADNCKPFWKWTVHGDGAVTLLLRLQPYLLSRRQARAIAAVDAHEERKLQPHYRVSRRGIGGRPTHRKKAQ